MAIPLVCGAECQIVREAAAGSSPDAEKHWRGDSGNNPTAVTSPVRTGTYAFSFVADATGDAWLPGGR